MCTPQGEVLDVELSPKNLVAKFWGISVRFKFVDVASCPKQDEHVQQSDTCLKSNYTNAVVNEGQWRSCGILPCPT